jgi:hypothetical protein
MEFWKQMFKQCSSKLPDFNDFLLTDFRKNNIDNSPNFLDTIFQEANKLFGDKITFHGHELLSPDDRLKYLASIKFLNGIDIRTSELALYKYKLGFEGKMYDVHMFLPYYHNRAITIESIIYQPLLAIIERTIYHQEHSVLIKVLRSPLKFIRLPNITNFEDIDNRRIFVDEPLIMVNAHAKANSGKNRNKARTSVILYLLATHGLKKTLQKFGFSLKDLYIYHEPVKNKEYISIKIKDPIKFKDSELESQALYLICRDSLCDNNSVQNRLFRRIIVAIINAMKDPAINLGIDANAFNGQNKEYNNLYVNPLEGALIPWKMILGKVIHGNQLLDNQILLFVNNHLTSLNTYLDPFTTLQLKHLDIDCKDIYDLFIQVFINFDQWMLTKKITNLYEKKIGVSELLHQETIKYIFNRYYNKQNTNPELTEKNFLSLIKMNSYIIKKIYLSQLFHKSHTAFNDNWLLTIGAKKYRQPANQKKRTVGRKDILTDKEQFFDPSYAGVETLTSIPNSNPGVAGTINPFLLIDEFGCIIQPAWTKELDELKNHIAYV